MSNTTCTVEECTAPSYAKGYCRKHYARVMRNGSPDITKPQGRAAWSPEAEAQYRAKVAAKAAARIEDIEWLIRDDHNAESVARRAGFKTAVSALSFLHRHGRRDLANRLYPFVGYQDVYSPEYVATVHGVAA